MSGSGFISVRNWRRFQHYNPAERTPPWVKLYTELLDDDDFRALTFAQRGLLQDVWKAYAKSRCALTGDTRALGQRLGQRVTSVQLDALVYAGFIDIVASKELAEGYRPASPSRAREEEEEEEDTPLPPQSGGGENRRANGRNPRARGENPRAVAKQKVPEQRARAWIANGLAREVPAAHLGEVIVDEFGIVDPELLAELIDLAKGHP